MRSPRHRLGAGTAVLLAAAVVVAGCSGGGSTSTAKPTTSASTSPSTSASSAAASPSTAPSTASSTVAAGPGSPAITAEALRQLVAKDGATNNVANKANSYSQLTGIDGSVELEEDRAYTKAGAVNGYRVPAFYVLAKHEAIPTTVGAGNQYAFAEVSQGGQPAQNGKLPGTTVTGISAYIKTAQGWRLANSLDVAKKQVPTFAAPNAKGVTSKGSAAAIKAASARVLDVANSCVTGKTSPLVTKPSSCGEIDAAKAVSSFHVTTALGPQHWPTYTVGMSGGDTLVLGTVDVTMTVRSAQGVGWQQATIVSGLLGLKAKTNPGVRRGYVEQLALSVALAIPANGGKATVLGTGTGDLSAHVIAAAPSTGGGISV